MYLGVDVGGTKTLVTVLNNDGIIRERAKFPTPKNYDHFLLELRHTLAHFKTKDFQAVGVGLPGRIDREHGRGIRFGNLPWRNVPIQHDLELTLHTPIVVENDAKMAGLSEAMLVKNKYQKVLYVTVSTGIGFTLIVNGTIDPFMGDSGGRSILVEHKGKLAPWESFASGHAIVERFGKMAKDIDDAETWRTICRDLSKGLIELIAITEPEAIIVGGSVGTHFKKYGKILNEEVKKYHLPLVSMPAIMGAQRPEEAVVYGCYDLAKQRFPHHAKTVA
jgi:glucokinase